MKKALGIQEKILSTLIPSVILMISIILILFYCSTSKLVTAKSESLLVSKAESVTNQVTAWINETLTVLDTEKDTLEFFSASPEEEKNYIKHTENQHSAFPSGIYIGTKDGVLTHASFNPDSSYTFFDKPWYIEGKDSEHFTFCATYLDTITQSYIVGASSMLKDKNGNFRGVASADIYLDTISEIVRPIQIEQTGAVFLVDGKTNTIIGSKSLDMVGVALNNSKDGMYQYVEHQIKAGSSGLNSYTAESGKKFYINIVKIPDTEWYTVAYVPRAEVLRDLNLLMRKVLIITLIATLLLSAAIFLILEKIIVKPIVQISDVAQRIANGELNQRIEYRSHDQLGTLAANFNKTVEKLRDYIIYIEEITAVLNAIGNGELDFKLTQNYAGEFLKIKNALEHISESLNRTLGEIDESANQVASGSDQIASGAQALSQGSTEQASSIETLAGTINDISEKVNHNAESSKQASQKTQEMIEEVQVSNQRMQDMLNAMNDISSKSNEIGKIIKTIEDIAFQTNILALNAAVEAARAGEAGKGFAVVADEVRNLANKSSEASKDTSLLIESSLLAVKNGTTIAGETAEALSVVVNNIKEISSSIEQISSASSEQSESIHYVTQGMDQISSVVQTNSATAEQSAAASEELSGQAQMLKELVGRFHLKQ